MAIARGAVRVVSFSLLAALALTGCPYVNNETYNEYKNKLDQDGDGSSLGGGGGMDKDCDDYDGSRSPTLAEEPYNGIDDDCDDLDNVDVDGDGYPKIAKSEWDELPGVNQAWWPTDVTTDPLKLDCADDDPNRHPDAPDTYYDGVDSDCRNDNDYDQDLDGYAPDEHAAAAGLPGGDCDDQNSQINPGVPASSDKWYDGIDQNCDCVNDYDQDGDGYMDAVEGTETRFAAMAALYDGFCTYDAALYGDCQDAEAPDGFLPDQIHPDATDEWYDGADSDCDGRNDFDQDEDGYFPTEHTAAYEAFVDWWGYTELTGDNDCDDLDAAVHPGTLEAIADVVDQDCDGGADTTSWAFGGILWDNPTEVVVDATDYNYVLATATDAISTSSTYQWPAMALWFDFGAGFQAEPANQLVWHNPVASSAGEIGSGLDLYTDGDRWYAAISYSRSVGGIPYTYLALRAATWDDTGKKFDLQSLKVSAIRDTTDFFHDVDVKKADDGWVWTLGCGSSYTATVACAQNGTVWCDTGYYVTSSTAATGAACFLDEPSSSTPEVALGTLCDGAGSCTSYDLDRSTKSITTSATQPYAAKAWDVVNDKLEWRVVVAAGALAIDDGAASYNVLGTYTVLNASADTAPAGDVYVAAVVEDESGDGQPDVVLAYGDPAGTLTEVVMPLSDGTSTWAPHSADVYADGDRVFIAASGLLPGGASSGTNDDAIGWIFFQAPPL